MTKHGERPDELAARLIVESNTGARLVLEDDGSAPGLVDYQVKRAGHPVGVLEVGRNTDPVATGSQMAWEKHASEPMSAPVLTRSWLVSCTREASFKGLQNRLLPLLERLESAGVDRVTQHDPRAWHEGTTENSLLQERVNSASSLSPNAERGPEVWVTVGYGESSAIGPEGPLVALETWLTSDAPDPTGMRRKLGTRAAHLKESHAFVWVDLRSGMTSWRWLNPEEALPNRVPHLPGEVTHVWLAGGDGGWRWAPESGWSRLTGIGDALLAARRAAGHA